MNKETYCYETKKDLFKGLKANPEGHLKCANCMFFDFCVSDLTSLGINPSEQVIETSLGESIELDVETVTYVNPFDTSETVVVENETNTELEISGSNEIEEIIDYLSTENTIESDTISVEEEPNVITTHSDENTNTTDVEESIATIDEIPKDIETTEKNLNTNSEGTDIQQPNIVDKVFEVFENVKVESEPTNSYDENEVDFLNMDDDIAEPLITVNTEESASVVDTILSEEEQSDLNEKYYTHKDTMNELLALPKRAIF